jgi:hypothetical protein
MRRVRPPCIPADKHIDNQRFILYLENVGAYVFQVELNSENYPMTVEKFTNQGTAAVRGESASTQTQQNYTPRQITKYS